MNKHTLTSLESIFYESVAGRYMLQHVSLWDIIKRDRVRL
jgi:hypothetical protein